MKLRCNDGVVRVFDIGGYFDFRVSSEGMCTHCGKLFGVHDLRILKPFFREHTCSYKGSAKLQQPTRQSTKRKNR
jgi:hypothetical protein